MANSIFKRFSTKTMLRYVSYQSLIMISTSGVVFVKVVVCANTNITHTFNTYDKAATVQALSAGVKTPDITLRSS